MGIVKEKIAGSFEEVRALSFQEKTSDDLKVDAAAIDGFLDAILALEAVLDGKIDRIERVVEDLEHYTWYDGLDEEDLMSLNDLISGARDLHGALIGQYIGLVSLRKKGIAKEELLNFKHALDDLKEVCADLESVFFHLPAMPEFVETSHALSLVG